jgi:hypothetical protein
MDAWALEPSDFCNDRVNALDQFAISCRTDADETDFIGAAIAWAAIFEYLKEYYVLSHT